MTRMFAAFLLMLSTFSLHAAEPTAAERGHKALTETAFIPAFWTNRVVQNAWKHWDGVTEKPAPRHDAADGGGAQTRSIPACRSAGGR